MVDNVVARCVFACRYGVSEVAFLRSIADCGVEVFCRVGREKVCDGAQFILGLFKVRRFERSGREGGS